MQPNQMPYQNPAPMMNGVQPMGGMPMDGGAQMMAQAGQAMPPANGQPGQPQQPQAPTAKENPNSTQATLLISELRDSMVIMKDGSFRAVVACKSINFDLMS